MTTVQTVQTAAVARGWRKKPAATAARTINAGQGEEYRCGKRARVLMSSVGLSNLRGMKRASESSWRFLVRVFAFGG